MHTFLEDEEPTRCVYSTCYFWRLYLSRFLAAWGNRQWWFGCALFVFQLRPTDLTLNACLGLAQSVSQVLLGSWLGAWIDKSERMLAVKVFLGFQNISISAACTLFAIFFYYKGANYDPLLFAGIVIALAVISELAALGNKIVVERDWVLQISPTEDALAKMNMIFQTIDLGCKTMAPIFVGLMIELTGLTITAITLAVWNIVSAIIEYILMSLIFKEYPNLLKSKTRNEGDTANSLCDKIRASWRAWELYMTHPTRNAGLCLAFFYMTVLAFGNTLWAYSLLQCVPESLLSLLVGAAAINGILGSITFPPLRKRFGVKCAGQLGVLFVLAALVPCVVSVFLPGSPWRTIPFDDGVGLSCPRGMSVYVLLTGVVLARFGVWLSDIAITQIQQEEAEEEIRGRIGGVQGSLCSALDVLKYVLVLLLPRASDFGYLVFASFFSVLCGVISYTSYAVPCRHRKKRSYYVMDQEVTSSKTKK